jgi:hypothetical protein
VIWDSVAKDLVTMDSFSWGWVAMAKQVGIQLLVIQSVWIQALGIKSVGIQALGLSDLGFSH